jgi:hypothetical protein
MIRYHLARRADLAAVASCQLPELARLRGRGPWTAAETTGGVCLTLARGPSVATWGPIQPGLGGLQYQLADPLPPFLAAEWIVRQAGATPVQLRCGHVLPIIPAASDGVEITLDGQLGGPVTQYGRLAATLWERLAAEDVQRTDPSLIEFCRLALLSSTTLTAELVHAFRLLASSDVEAILEVAAGLPKVEPGGPG